MKTDIQACSPTIQLAWLEEREKLDSEIVVDTILNILMRFGRKITTEQKRIISLYLDELK